MLIYVVSWKLIGTFSDGNGKWKMFDEENRRCLMTPLMDRRQSDGPERCVCKYLNGHTHKKKKMDKIESHNEHTLPKAVFRMKTRKRIKTSLIIKIMFRYQQMIRGIIST